jgi:hypothetical protein
MNALEMFSQQEIDTALAEHVLEQPDKRPNEGHIRDRILRKRGVRKPRSPMPREEIVVDDEERKRRFTVLSELAADIRRKM